MRQDSGADSWSHVGRGALIPDSNRRSEYEVLGVSGPYVLPVILTAGGWVAIVSVLGDVRQTAETGRVSGML